MYIIYVCEPYTYICARLSHLFSPIPRNQSNEGKNGGRSLPQQGSHDCSTCRYSKHNAYGCFQKYWYPKMDGLQWKTLLKLMIWGFSPYFWVDTHIAYLPSKNEIVQIGGHDWAMFERWHVYNWKMIRCGWCYRSHLANGPWKKSLNFIFPTKYGIPKSSKG